MAQQGTSTQGGQQNVNLTSSQWTIECKSTLEPSVLERIMKDPEWHETATDALTAAALKFARDKGHPDTTLELTMSEPENIRHHGNGGGSRQQQYGQQSGQQAGQHGQGQGRGGTAA